MTCRRRNVQDAPPLEELSAKPPEGASPRLTPQHSLLHQLRWSPSPKGGGSRSPAVKLNRRWPQNDFGRPSTWVATWLRIRLVEIGATW